MSDRKSTFHAKTHPPLRKALRSWYLAHARPLPWRTEPSLYRTVVSEFMCQQTQIDTVLPYFERWMQSFPDFATLARAEESSVLKHWEGLGYYSRARNLHKLARALVLLPSLPQKPAEWQQLPGVGPYTAAAISSISCHYPAAVVDGNVIRVLARLTAEQTPIKSSSEAIKRFQPLADAFLDPDHPGDHNQALMELGATVCLKARPLCLLCPLREACAAVQTDQPEAFPVIVRRPTEKVTIARLFAVWNGNILFQRAARHSRRLADLCELPRAEDFPLSQRGEVLFTGQRGISHQRITEPIHRAVSPENCIQSFNTETDGLFWHPIVELDAITLSGPHRKWIRQLLTQP